MIDMQFFPMGFQYYRAPTPERRFWESDLRKMSEQGFNTVKYWVQWRWSERKEGVFDFSDLDELMDLAQKYGLKVILNLILDVSPSWFVKRFPDADYIDVEGRPHRSMAIDCRQIGGAPGPCVHHDMGVFYRERFTEAMAEHFKDHPALWVYDVWNEPNLNFKADRTKFGTMICYCENSQRKFRDWLRKKYHDIETLNELWGKCYNDFDEAEPPRMTGVGNEFIDWRLFFADSITEDLKMRIRAVKKHDRKHPVMCHTVPYPIFSGVFNTTDDFAMAEQCDLFGNSVGSNPFAANLLVDSARGKDVINAEVHIVSGHAITGYVEPNCEDIQRHYLLPLARGIKGFMVWQYRPESLGSEAPCWGNIDALGNDRKWQKDCIVLGKIFREHESLLLGQEPRKPHAAIYFEPKSEYYTFSMTGSTELYDEAMTGLYQYLYDCNKDISFIREKDIEKGALDFDVVFLPATFCFRSSLTEKLREFVYNGGTLVIDPLTGIHDEETGRYAPIVPGCGIDELAGVTLTSCYHKDRLGDEAFSDPVHKTFFIDYGGKKLVGKNFRAYYQPEAEGAKKVAEFADGTAAIWEREFGKGKVIVLGSTLSACYPAKENYDFYSGLGRTESWKKNFPFGVRADFVSRDGRGFLIIENRTDKPFLLDGTVLKGKFYSLYRIEDGNLTEQNEHIEKVTIPEKCVRMFAWEP